MIIVTPADDSRRLARHAARAGAPVAQLLAIAAMPQSAIEARFKCRGLGKKSLTFILDTFEALGRARRDGAGWRRRN